jgi:hypothetical protein
MAGGRWREVEGQQLRQRLSQRQRQQQQFPFQPAKKRQTKSVRGPRMSKKGGNVQKRLRVVKSTSREGWEVVENGAWPTLASTLLGRSTETTCFAVLC